MGRDQLIKILNEQKLADVKRDGDCIEMSFGEEIGVITEDCDELRAIISTFEIRQSNWKELVIALKN